MFFRSVTKQYFLNTFLLREITTTTTKVSLGLYSQMSDCKQFFHRFVLSHHIWFAIVRSSLKSKVVAYRKQDCNCDIIRNTELWIILCICTCHLSGFWQEEAVLMGFLWSLCFLSCYPIFCCTAFLLSLWLPASLASFTGRTYKAFRYSGQK